MKNVYFARQPILDGDLNLYGYELLFRADPNAQTSGRAPLVDGDRATAHVLDAVSWRGLEHVTNGKLGFVNFTKQLLLDGVATLYPKEYLTVEVLENVEVDDKVLDAVRHLKENGYTIALDDYIYQPGHEELLEMVDIIKVEVSESPESLKNASQILWLVDTDKCTLLAEKVESQQVFEQYRDLGFSLFQGYFFAKPTTLLEQTVDSLRINYLRLIIEVSRPEVDFTAIANILKQDVGLSYKILKLVNSAFFGLSHEISNIRQAVVFLGTRELKKWISFVSLSNMCDSKPNELILMSLVRAHFCEMIAFITKRNKESDAYFLAGMFSLLDALIDVDIATALSGITVPKITSKALLEEDNPGHFAVELIAALERGDWNRASEMSLLLKVDADKISDIYLDSIEWGTALLADLLK